MIHISAQEICDATGGSLLAGSPDREISRICTDTRTDLEGSLFVALTGKNFDGGDFVEEALATRAAGVLAASPAARRAATADMIGSEPCLIIEVDDAAEALGKIASAVARKSLAKIIAVTGSTGKTTTKDMLFELVRHQTSAIATQGSLNNEIGVPLSILRLEPDTRVAVLEMGMQRPGEIAELCALANPEIAVITNIGPAHLEHAGTLENIARAKAEVGRSLPPHGGLVIPFGESLLDPHIEDIDAEVITFGFEQEADVHVVSHAMTERRGLECVFSVLGEELSVELPFTARYHLLNFMAALGAYVLLGLPLDGVPAAAGSITLTAMRGERIDLGNGVSVIDDSYNANPLSMDSALEHLVSLAQGRRAVAILGDMAELGECGPAYHHQAGSMAAQLGVECIVAVGILAASYLDGARAEGGCLTGCCYHFSSVEDAAARIGELIAPGDFVLVKASRFMRLEQLIDRIAQASDSCHQQPGRPAADAGTAPES